MIIAAIQMTSSSKKEENYEKGSHYIEKAARAGAQLIVLPEHWNWLGPTSQKKAAAEDLEGPSISLLQNLAKTHQCWIVGGSIVEKNGEFPPYNTSVVISPSGDLSKPYRKIHLFDAQVGTGHRESETTTCGAECAVIKTPFGKLGIAICYDIRFPELFLKYSKEGVELFAIPANFTQPTGEAHWEVLLRARAIETQSFVAASAQVGLTGAGWEAYGHSMITDPWGKILANAHKKEGVIVAEFNSTQIQDLRVRMPIHSHRRMG